MTTRLILVSTGWAGVFFCLMTAGIFLAGNGPALMMATERAPFLLYSAALKFALPPAILVGVSVFTIRYAVEKNRT